MNPDLYIAATDLRSRLTFVVEPCHKGSRKVKAFALPAEGRALDSRVNDLRRVPREILRSARNLFEAHR